MSTIPTSLWSRSQYFENKTTYKIQKAKMSDGHNELYMWAYLGQVLDYPGHGPSF